MSATSPYLLDTNIYLDAMKRYYAFDLCPVFWARFLH